MWKGVLCHFLHLSGTSAASSVSRAPVQAGSNGSITWSATVLNHVQCDIKETLRILLQEQRRGPKGTFLRPYSTANVTNASETNSRQRSRTASVKKDNSDHVQQKDERSDVMKRKKKTKGIFKKSSDTKRELSKKLSMHRFMWHESFAVMNVNQRDWWSWAECKFETVPKLL